MPRIISKIEARTPTAPVLIPTAAYARVSGGRDAQLHSLSSQISYYSDYIQSRGNWEYKGVFTDEAYTGTRDTRKGLQALLDECRAGNILQIITKSISRFARNTVDLLSIVREMRSIGVGIYFEEQRIDTMSSDGELMLAILASYAQEESRSASENCLWRIKERFKKGEPVGLFTMFGYRYENGELTIHDDEAEVVRMIFADYLVGLGGKRIADKLRAMDIPTTFGGKWTANRIATIIKNEKYTGNSLLQKAYTIDHLSKLRRANRGQRTMYYSEDTHPAIIDQETFDKAQEIMESRRKPNMVYLNRYPFTSKIVCGACGGFYKRKVTHGIPGWQCSTYLNEGRDSCQTIKIREDILMAKTAEALGLNEFDDEAFAKRVERIIVPKDYRLLFEMADGSNVELSWEHRSRRESWTDEMKQAARERIIGGRDNG